MVIKTIDAAVLKKAFLAGAARIEAKKEIINELNVFPVPDGDTGTNMTLTIMSAAKEVNGIEQPTIKSLAKAISSGSLRGARGNSGVILSQLFRGFCKEIQEHEEISVPVMCAAFGRAVETAYKAVMKPKEGTILTVARGGSERAAELLSETDDLAFFCGEVISHMEKVLAQTPELLPVLKEAGVVDSGGQGLLEVLKGAYDALLGKEVDLSALSGQTVQTGQASGGQGTFSTPKTGITDDLTTADIKFGYCTEFIILLEKEFPAVEEQAFKTYLESLGDSIVVVADDEIVKVHVHTNDPGLAIQKALTYGSLTSMKIDNMREEHNERVIQNAEKAAAEEQKKEQEAAASAQIPRKENGFISVSVGEGLSEIFKGLGVDYIIEGGQTMNPSTEDMLQAIEKVPADHIFILPNNKNILMAADQAKSLTEDKDIIVIPSTTIPQGITAVINYVYDSTPEENEARMTEEMRRVKSGQVTYAVRDTSIDGMEIGQGDIMGLGDKTILSVGAEVPAVTMELVERLVDEDSELITLYYGEEVTEEDAKALAEKLSGRYPELDVEVHSGGQPIYYYILSVE